MTNPTEELSKTTKILETTNTADMSGDVVKQGKKRTFDAKKAFNEIMSDPEAEQKAIDFMKSQKTPDKDSILYKPFTI